MKLLIAILVVCSCAASGQVPKGELRQFDQNKWVNGLAMDTITIDDVIAQTIPIYTRKKPNPKSGKADCNITVTEKNHFRYVMKMKLKAAKTDEERQKVIDHYKQLFSEGQ